MRLTWNLSRFVPNSVEILKWILQKKLFWENFSEILSSTKAIIYHKLVKFRPTFWNFILGPYCAEKFTEVLSYVVCTEVRRHIHKQITKRRYGGEKPGRFVFGKPVLLTIGLGFTTPYSLGILVWNFYQTFVTVSTEFLLIFEPEINPTRLAINFLFITARAKMKVCVCVKLFDFFVGEYSSVWPKICRVFSEIQWRFLRGISGKNYFGRIFQKFCPLPRLLSTTNLWNFATLSEILFWVCIALKIFTQVLSYVVCTQVRRHVYKQITKRRYGGRFVFGKPVLFTLSLGLTTAYSLGILLWNF